MGRRKPFVDALVIGDPSTASWHFLDLIAKANPGVRIRVEGDDKRWLICIFNRKGILLAQGQATTRHDALQELMIAIAEAARAWRKSTDQQLQEIKIPPKERA